MTSTTHRDVIAILTEDHHEVLDLISTVKHTTDPAARRDVADTVIAEIVRHSIAEEMYVYPAMREALPDGEHEVQHDIEEHQQLEETMKALEGADPAHPEFDELIGRLEEQLRHHASDEETEQFPLLRAHLSAEKLKELGGKVETAKAIAPTRPHPGAPHSPLFHKLAGPGVGMVDKLRDALSGRST